MTSNMPANFDDRQLAPKGCEDYGTPHCVHDCNLRPNCPEMDESETFYEFIQAEIEKCKLIERTSTNSCADAAAIEHNTLKKILSVISPEMAAMRIIKK